MNKKILFVPLFLMVILYLLFLFGLFSNINLKLTDNLYGSYEVSNEIVIIEIDDYSLNSIGRWPWNRNNFTSLLDKLDNSKVVGLDIAFFEETKEDINLSSTLLKLGNVVLAAQYLDYEKEFESNVIIGKNLQKPVKILDDNSEIGYIDIIVDSDGVARSLNLNIKNENNIDVLSFSEKIYSIAYNKNVEYDKNRYLVNFLDNQYNGFKYYSFYDVIDDKIDLSEFDDKIVLVGASALSLQDNFIVPTSKGTKMPGVEFHASVINTMILDNNLKVVDNIFVLFIMLFLSYLIYFISFNLRFFYSIFIVIFIIIIYLFISIFVFDKYNLILNLVYPIIALIVTFFGVIIIRYLTEEKKKKEIQLAFSKYVSPDLINEILKNPKKLTLGGEKKEITILFSDIAGFTTISEKLSPEDLVYVLNDYLTNMTNIILENKGTVDKYIGDAIMAFWNAPVDIKNHYDLAIKTALLMNERLVELSKKYLDEHGIEVKARIGLHIGDVIVGNMGSDNRFDYTLIGDNVNLTARLESINKYYGTYIMISEDLYLKLSGIEKEKYLCREIDLVKVKGKDIPTKIYELIAFSSIPNDIKKTIEFKIKVYREGLSAYKEQNFKLAKEKFSSLVEKYDDAPSKTFLKRCSELESVKLPKNWDGVYTMSDK